LPPDINHSDVDFTVEGNAIRFGLGAVKNVGKGLIRSMVTKRQDGGPFRSLEDFLQRMGDADLNKRAVENFIKCGSMDCFGHHRSELLAVYDTMMDSISASRRKNLEGQIGLFTMLQSDDKAAEIPIPKLAELNRADLMLMEKETTGIYLSGHPMDDYRHLLKNTRIVPIGALLDEENNYRDNQDVSIAGIVQSIKLKTTRNNSTMAYVSIEDDTASIEMLVFSNALNQYGGYLRENQPVVIHGRLSLRDDKDSQIIVNRAVPMTQYADRAPEEAVNRISKPIVQTLYLRLPSEEGMLFPKVRAIINMFPGNSKVVVYFADTKQRRGAQCNLDSVMLAELRSVLGEENVVVK